MANGKIPRKDVFVSTSETLTASSFGQVGIPLSFQDYDIVSASVDVGNVMVIPYCNGSQWALVGKFMTDYGPLTGTHVYYYTYRRR